jgi:Glycosyltransferase family 87
MPHQPDTPAGREPAPWLWFGLASCVILGAAIFKGSVGLDPAIPPKLRVFGAFWASGWAASNGLNPFALHALSPETIVPGVFDINLSPPALLPLFALVSRFDPTQAVRVWIILQAVLFILATSILLATARGAVRSWQAFWMLLTPQVYDGIQLGQDYAVLYLIAVLGWVALRAGRPLAAGVLIGLLVAAKPNFALWPLFLLLVGGRRPAIIAFLCAAALWLLPALLYGPPVYSEWLAAVASDRHWVLATDASLHGVAARLGEPLVGTMLAAVLIAAGGVLVWWRRPAKLAASGLALAIGIVASPLAWSDYLVFLLPAFVERQWGKPRYLAVALLTVPPGIPLLAMHHGLAIAALGGLIYTAAFLLIIGGMAALIWAEKGQGSALDPSRP